MDNNAHPLSTERENCDLFLKNSLRAVNEDTSRGCAGKFDIDPTTKKKNVLKEMCRECPFYNKR